jgi:hypothetical protein
MSRAFARSWVALLTLALVDAGCFRVETDTRTERGSLLRSYQRETELPDTKLQLDGQVRWPVSHLHLYSYRQCVVEDIDEYADLRIINYDTSNAAVTLASGGSNFVLGLGLFLSRNLFYHTPPSPGAPVPRDVVTITSYVLMGLGLPAAIVGLIGLTQGSQRTEVTRTPEVVTSHSALCHPVSATGELTAVRDDGTSLAPLHVVDGEVELNAEAIRGHSITGFLLGSAPPNTEPIHVLPETQTQLDALIACFEVIPAPDEETLAAAGPKQRTMWQMAAQLCNRLPGAPAGSPARYAPRP